VRHNTAGLTLLDTVVYYDASAGGPIANGQSRARQFSFRLPDGTNGAGTLTFTVTADAHNQVAEYNAGGTGESNNTALLSRTSTLAAYPDLAVDRFEVGPPIFESSGQVTAGWIITNIGTAPIIGDFYDRLLVRNLSLGSTILDQAYYLNPSADTNGPIAVGQSRTRSTTFRLLDGPGRPVTSVALFLDSGNRIFEFRDGLDAELNNTTNVTRTRPWRPTPPCRQPGQRARDRAAGPAHRR
jgi:hypothetical protein